MNHSLRLRDRVRFADAFLDQLHHLGDRRRAELRNQGDLVEAHLFRVRHLTAACRRSQHRGWTGAWRRSASRLRDILRDLPFAASQWTAQLERSVMPPPPKPRQLLAELDQLIDEFPDVALRSAGPELIVTTEPIVLEGTYLGAFAIHLHVDRLRELDRDAPLRIEGLDPRPAARNNSVPHPHVSDARICLGEATEPVRRALESGRVCDAFLLVRSVLNTYNPHSAYVELDSWDGIACYDCGSVQDPEDLHYCEHCGHDYCLDCTASCEACKDSACRGCLEACEVCGRALCPSCIQSCPQCKASLCSRCHEQRACACREENDDDPREDHAAARTSGGTFQPVGMGEAFVPA